MAVVISEIVTEVVAAPQAARETGGGLSEEAVDAIVRRAAERVLETLRREWDR